MLERTSTPISLPKKKRPPSSWWVGPQVMAKHGGEGTTVKLNQPGKGCTFRALVVDICGIWWRHFFEEMFGWTCLGRQVGSGRYFIVNYIPPIQYSTRSLPVYTTYKYITPLLYIIYIQTIHHTCVYRVNKMYSTTVRYDCDILL